MYKWMGTSVNELAVVSIKQCTRFPVNIYPLRKMFALIVLMEWHSEWERPARFALAGNYVNWSVKTAKLLTVRQLWLNLIYIFAFTETLVVLQYAHRNQIIVERETFIHWIDIHVNESSVRKWWYSMWHKPDPISRSEKRRVAGGNTFICPLTSSCPFHIERSFNVGYILTVFGAVFTHSLKNLIKMMHGILL